MDVSFVKVIFTAIFAVFDLYHNCLRIYGAKSIKNLFL